MPPPPYGYPPQYPVYQRPPRRVARANWSVILPITGVALVAIGVLALPWSEDIWIYQILSHADAVADSSPAFGLVYAVGLAIPMVLFGGLLAFAANLDSAVFRWLHFGLATALLCCVGGLGIFGAAGAGAMLGGDREGAEAQDAWTGLGIGAGIAATIVIVVFLLFLGLAFIKGLALRILGGLMLLGYALIAALGVTDLYAHSQVDPYPWAFLPAFGWLLCAIGAFSGPRYEWV